MIKPTARVPVGPNHLAAPRAIDPARPQPQFAAACALALVAKAPQPGRSKTRLVPPLTADAAAELSGCFLRDTLGNVADAAAGRPAIRGGVVFTPADAGSMFDALVPPGFWTLPQRDGALGERLFGATQDLLAAGFGSVCLIGSDSPTLPLASYLAAVDRLAAPGERVVLGPSADGGYYLIGLTRARPELFLGIPWSTADVLHATADAAARLGLPVEQLDPWYDIDDAASLARLRRELLGPPAASGGSAGAAAPHTRAFLVALEARAAFTG